MKGRQHGRRGDYARADAYLSDHFDDIEFEYGKKYDDCTRSEKTQVILELFFNGQEGYAGSARDLRDGIGTSRELGISEISVSHILMGRSRAEHRVIRDEKGRFKKWLD